MSWGFFGWVVFLVVFMVMVTLVAVWSEGIKQLPKQQEDFREKVGTLSPGDYTLSMGVVDAVNMSGFPGDPTARPNAGKLVTVSTDGTVTFVTRMPNFVVNTATPTVPVPTGTGPPMMCVPITPTPTGTTPTQRKV